MKFGVVMGLKLQDRMVLILFYIYIYKKKAWPLIGEEIFLLVSESFKTSTMPKGINNAYITLIPEIKKS